MTTSRVAVLFKISLAFAFAVHLLEAADEIPTHRAKQIFDSAPAAPRAKPARPRRVLIWNTRPHLIEKDPHKGYCIPYGTEAFRVLGAKTGAYEPMIGDDLALLLPENIRQFDAIVLNNASGPWIKPTDADMEREVFKKVGRDKSEVESALRRSFMDYIENGGGIVSIHFALAANRDWPEFGELVGAKFTGHPWNEEVGVKVDDSAHPLVRAFNGEDFSIADEIYEYGSPYDRSRMRVLLSLDPARSNMGVKWINRKDGDWALAWVKSHGKGRVFNTSFGHRTEIYWNPQILAFYLDAVQFAAGDIIASTAPIAKRGDPPAPGSVPVPGLDGFVSLFNGSDLSGWNFDPQFWSVRDGAIVGETTAAVRVRENNFLIWKNEVEDFELRLKFKLEGGNSGIYYRARKRPPGQTKGEALVGTQADFSADGRWTGVMMEYTLREILAERGQQVRIDETGEKQVIGTLGDPASLLAKVKTNDWNDYAIVARGGKVKIAINGTPMSEIDDRDPKRLTRGWLGLQVHAGPPMRVQFKDVYYRKL
jgi:type 1 glutamine amidotransferase